MANLEPEGVNPFAWQKPRREAVVEINPEILKQKVAEAELAIFERLQELSGATDSAAERGALEDASNTLRVLKKEILKYPDWKSD
jgi:hypothetical protein